MSYTADTWPAFGRGLLTLLYLYHIDNWKPGSSGSGVLETAGV